MYAYYIDGSETYYLIEGLENGVTYDSIYLRALAISIGPKRLFSSDALRQNYTINFNSDGGSWVDSQVVEQGQYAWEPDGPVRDGYNFLGWYYEWDPSVRFDFDAPIYGDANLIAKWEVATPPPTEPAVRTFKVIFDCFGIDIPSQTVEKGKTATRPPNPERDNRTFFGWFNGDTRYDFSLPVNAISR